MLLLRLLRATTMPTTGRSLAPPSIPRRSISATTATSVALISLPVLLTTFANNEQAEHNAALARRPHWSQPWAMDGIGCKREELRRNRVPLSGRERQEHRCTERPNRKNGAYMATQMPRSKTRMSLDDQPIKEPRNKGASRALNL